MKFNKKASGLRTFFLSIIVLMVILFLFLGFSTQFLQLQNPTSPLLNDSQFGLLSAYNNLNNSLSGVRGVANNIENQTQSSSPDPTSYVFLIFRGAFEVPISILSFTFASIVNLESIIFNISGATTFGSLFLLMLNLMIAGMTFTLIFLVIKYIRSGESER